MIIISVPFVVEAGLRLMTWLGLIFMPFAALISGCIARSRGLSPLRYAISGAALSALLFIPWMYFVLRLFNKSIPVFVAVVGYGLLYSSIMIGHIGIILILFIVLEEENSPSEAMADFAYAMLVALLLSGAFLATIAIWKQHLQRIAWLPVHLISLVAQITPFIIALVGVIFFHLFFYIYSPFDEIWWPKRVR